MNGNPRTTARVVLATVAVLLCMFVLFATGPVGGLNVVFAQTASASPCPAGVNIEWVNPSANGHTEVSAEDKAGDQPNTGAYHLVAWVNSVPSGATVAFKYSSDDVAGGNDQTITNNATRVGNDTFEHQWPSGDLPPDGAATMKAQIFVSGTLCDQDTQEVTINDDAEEADPTGPSPATAAAESVEITSPTNGSAWGVYRHPESTRSGGVIKVKTSTGQTTTPPAPPDDSVTYVRLQYSISAPGTEPAWKECGNSPVSSTNMADGERCEFAAGDEPEEVNLVGAIANDQPGSFPRPPADATFNDSSDGHRVLPYRQNATTVTAVFQDANGANSGSPAANQASGATVGACSPYLMVTVLDQNSQPIAEVNVDGHAQGPTDSLRWASDSNTHAFKNPDKSSHTSEAAWACGTGPDGADGSSGGNQGDHERADNDIKHIESTNDTNESGQFRVRLHSPDSGNTQIVMWADEDADDQHCSSEASGTASIAWGSAQAAPSPTGIPSEETICPVPGETITPTNTTTTTTAPATSTTSAPGTTTTTATTGPSVHRAATSVSRLSYRRGSFRGRVSSTSNDCVGDRLVLIKKVRRGRDRTVARDRTNGQGRFVARERRARGRYYAIVTAKTIETPTMITHCERARSRTKRVRR